MHISIKEIEQLYKISPTNASEQITYYILVMKTKTQCIKPNMLWSM